MFDIFDVVTFEMNEKKSGFFATTHETSFQFHQIWKFGLVSQPTNCFHIAKIGFFLLRQASKKRQLHNNLATAHIEKNTKKLFFTKLGLR